MFSAMVLSLVHAWSGLFGWMLEMREERWRVRLASNDSTTSLRNFLHEFPTSLFIIKHDLVV